MLQLKNVEKKYTESQVLYIPSFQFDNGINWVKGANGSGKTTLLKIVAGLLPFKGDILCNGISLKTNPLDYKRKIGWSEAEPLFPPFISGMNLISLYRNIRGVSRKEAETLIGLFEMNEYINNPVETYSAGMAKKLSLSLALLGNPSVIVLDEPFITLDTNTLLSVFALIYEKTKDDETIFLLSSHQEPDTRPLTGYRKFILQDKCILPV